MQALARLHEEFVHIATLLIFQTRRSLIVNHFQSEICTLDTIRNELVLWGAAHSQLVKVKVHHRTTKPNAAYAK